MDEVDEKILKVLIENARRSYKEIAKRVGISDVAVHKRIKRLEGKVIKGYVPLVSQKALGMDIACILTVKCMLKDRERIASEIAEIPQVREVYTTIGEQDIVAKLRAEDIGSLRDIVERKISKIKGINEVRASIVFNCIKEESWLVCR